jgi:hypothetical protein
MTDDRRYVISEERYLTSSESFLVTHKILSYNLMNDYQQSRVT